MPLPRTLLALSLGSLLALGGVSQAAGPKTYQVTGPVLELTDTTITVQKGDEKWEIARDAAVKVKGGDLKVGAKVTIEYTMSAKNVEVKTEGKAAATPANVLSTPAPAATPAATPKAKKKAA